MVNKGYHILRSVFALAFIFSVLLFPNVSLAQQSKEATKKDWTLMIYAASNYDIEECVRNALLKINSNPPAANVNVVMLYDPGSDYESAYYIFENTDFTELKKLGETNMGSPQVLYDFLKFSMTNYPAKNYALSIFSHGSGWISLYGPGSADNPVDSSKIPINPLISTAHAGQRNPPKMTGRSIGYDSEGHSKDCLSLLELNKALSTACNNFNGGKKLNLFIANACLFGMFETAFEIKDAVEYIICTENFMMTNDIDYATLVKAMSAGVEARLVGQNVVKKFEESGAGTTMVCLSVQKIEENIAILSDIARLLKKSGKTIEDFHRIKNYVEKDYPYIDINDLMDSILSNDISFKSESEVNELKALATSFQQNYGKLVAFFASKSSGFSGLSLYWPNKKHYNKYREAYKLLSISQKYQWDDYLDSSLLRL